MNETRRWIIVSIFFSVGFAFLIRLFSIQVLNDEYKLAAEQNAVQKIVTYPHRGLIYDRKGKLLVVNEPIFNIMVIPNRVKVEDTLEFCRLLKITSKDFQDKMLKAKQTPNTPSIFIKQLSQTDFAKVQDKLIDYQGFYPEFKTIRSYPHESMANTLGYIGEISKERLAKDTTNTYTQGDFIGVNGIEASYEKELRGKLGVKDLLVDVKGNEKGVLRNIHAQAGQDLITTIDLDLQQYGELLMSNKLGSIVAIEPSTGEILAMVSSPSYNPNLLILGKAFSKNYAALAMGEEKPLFNRPVMSTNPPGSAFKVVQALVGLQEGVLVPETRLSCDMGLVKCHGHPSPANVHQSIQFSCNPYYFKVLRRIIYQNKIVREKINDSTEIYKELPDGDGKVGLEKWKKYMHKFGLGEKVGIDLLNYNGGFVPNYEFFNTKHGEGNWQFNNIYSLGIGQGEMSITPLQMANIAAIIANKGFFYTPHLVKSIGRDSTKRSEFKVKRDVGVDLKHFEVVVDAMEDAVRAGTVTPQGILYDIVVCGKTGTVQNPHGEDHSVYIAFAPKKNPKIAIAIYVENAGWGGSYAAPIGSLIIEKYLNGKVERKQVEQSMVTATFSKSIIKGRFFRPEKFLTKAPRMEKEKKEGEDEKEKSDADKNQNMIKPEGIEESRKETE